MDERVVVFHHIPKCGGTTLKKALGRWFRRRDDYRPGWATGRRLERFQKRPVDLSRLRPGTLLCGHFELEGIYLHQRYPEVLVSDRFRLVTFVRDPWKLRLSLLRFEIERGRRRGDEPIEALLFDRPDWLSQRFPCGAGDFESVLDRYDFIGVIEHSQEDFDELADRLGKPRFALPRRNRTRPRDFGLTEAHRERFVELNGLDYGLYESCLERRARRRAALSC